MGVFGVIELWGHGDPGIGGGLEMGVIGIPQLWGPGTGGGPTAVGVPEVGGAHWGPRSEVGVPVGGSSAHF